MSGIAALSSRDERRIMGVIESAIEHTKNCPTVHPDEALSKAAQAAKLEPELVKRACEAFNKAKSVYMLTKLGAEKRAESFPLSDPERVVRSMYGEPVATPSLRISHNDFSGYGLPELKTAMQKAAADTSEEAPADGLIACRRAHDSRKTQEHEEKQAESEARQHRLASELAIDNIVSKMRHMAPADMQKAASLTVNKFKDDGRNLVQVLSAKLDRELSLEKTAEHAIFPAAEPYVSIDKVIEEARQYRIQKEACLKKKFRFVKQGQFLDSASALMNTAMSPAVEMTKAPIEEFLSKPRGLKSEDTQLFAPTFQYRLKNFQNSQSFVDVASDPFVKNYKMDTITEAFNHVIGVMPELSGPRYRQVLTALVRKQLAQENLFDPAELSTLAKSMGELVRAEQGRKQDEDAMQGRIDAGVEGSKKPLSTGMAATITGGMGLHKYTSPLKSDSGKSGKSGGGKDSLSAGRRPADAAAKAPEDIAAKTRLEAATDMYKKYLEDKRTAGGPGVPPVTVNDYDRKFMQENLPGVTID